MDAASTLHLIVVIFIIIFVIVVVVVPIAPRHQQLSQTRTFSVSHRVLVISFREALSEYDFGDQHNNQIEAHAIVSDNDGQPTQQSNRWR
jgi:hypothetical protein